MAIKRISELDLFTYSDLSQFLSTAEGVVDSSFADESKVFEGHYDPAKLSAGLWFEVSTPLSGLICVDPDKNEWQVKPVNEEPSYYLSKKINAEDLGNIITQGFKDLIKKVLYGPVNYIGSQNIGEPISSNNDGVDEYWYDDRPYLPDESGELDLENPNRLSVMVSADFANWTTFHNRVDFHGRNGTTTFSNDDSTYSWNGRTINLSGPWTFFGQDILVNGTAYLNNLTVAGIINGCALCACWADLAENYESDKPYPPGTLVQFGGEKELTIATDHANAVVTTKPGFFLNGNPMKNGLGIALVGKVPVRIIGKVKKFDKICLSEIPGIGKAMQGTDHIGISLESSDNEDEKLINCIVQLKL